MNLPNLFRRLLSWLRFGRSPQRAQPRVDVPATFAVGVAAVVDPPQACDLARFEETRRIAPAVQRAVPVAPDDKFGPAGVPRGRGGSQVYGPVDDLHGPVNRGRWTS